MSIFLKNSPGGSNVPQALQTFRLIDCFLGFCFVFSLTFFFFNATLFPFSFPYSSSPFWFPLHYLHFGTEIYFYLCVCYICWFLLPGLKFWMGDLNLFSFLLIISSLPSTKVNYDFVTCSFQLTYFLVWNRSLQKKNVT